MELWPRACWRRYRLACRLVLLGSMEEARGDAASAFARAKATEGLEFVEVQDEAALREALADADLIVDAVVGTGFKPPLRGLAAVARDLIATMKRPVVAVDLPSGWDADSTAQTSADESGVAQAFRADAVVTFVAPKMAHVFGHLTPGSTFGPVVVAPIGTPVESMPAQHGAALDGDGEASDRAPARCEWQQGQVRSCADRGWKPGQGGCAVDGERGCDARGCWADDGGGSAVGAADGRGGCAGADVRAAGGDERIVAGSARRAVAGEAAEGHNGGRHRAGVGTGGNDAGVCARVCGARVAADGGRCGCAECASRAGRSC